MIYQDNLGVWQRLKEETEKAIGNDEVPVAAAVVHKNKIIAISHNLVESNQCALDHAEMVVLRQAKKKLGEKYLMECDLYVTLEPCPMCAHAIFLSKVQNVFFGAYDPEEGSAEHSTPALRTRAPSMNIVGGFHEMHFKEELQRFFKKKR